MTRKNSSCKLHTLIRKCSAREGALFAISFLALLCAQPVYILLYIQSNARYTDMTDASMRADLMHSVYSALLNNVFGLGSLAVLAVVAGIAMFRYLHVRKQTDFFHALPVKRGQLFLSHVLTGILTVIPAYIIGMLLSCAMISANGFGEVLSVREIGTAMLAQMAGFLLIYAVSVLAAIVCGNTLVSVLVCGWFQLGLWPAWKLCSALLCVLYPARVIQSTSTPIWMTPAGIGLRLMTQGKGAGLRGILVTAAASLVLLALAYVLNNIRRSEHTGLSIAFPVIELPFKLYMVSVVGVFCGLLFESMTGKWSMMFFGMALGALITACVVEVVYDQDFHSLFRRWRSLLVYFVVAAILLCVMGMDLTGWNSRLPAREDIVSANLTSNSESWDCGVPGSLNSSYLQNYTVGDFLLNLYGSTAEYANVSSWYDVDTAELMDYAADVKPFQNTKNIDAIYAAAQLGAEQMKENHASVRADYQYQGDMDMYSVTFTLQNGKTFQRTYYMPMDTEELAQTGETVRASQEYRSSRTVEAVAQKNKSKAKQITVVGYSDMTYDRTITNAQAIPVILDTLQEEALANTDTSYHAPVVVLHIAGQYAVTDAETRSPIEDAVDDDVIDIAVYDYEKKTLALLETYANSMPDNFKLEDIEQIDIDVYEDDSSDTVTKTYTSQEALQKLFPGLLSDNFAQMIYYTTDYMEGNSAGVYLSNGDYISCWYYPDLAVDLSEVEADE